MDELRLEVNGEDLVLDSSGALWWPAERTLVAADLHFEKGSFYALSGQFLPPYDTRATLKRLRALAGRYAPRRIVALGDSFHDRLATERMDALERGLLMAMAEEVEWIWIAGNHDPSPPAWCGRALEEIAIGNLVFRHEPSIFRARGEVAGHLHPCKTVTRRGRSLRRRCFVSDGARIVLPAFGAYAGGLDVGDRAVRSLFEDAFRAYVLGQTRVYAVAA
ncbi:MAG TPA: ligase-associated DNA damage response endonuclease PdeM [Rhizomicrobium sp.]|nr:ligase-associated DNA damage response endonuclease PdeM [Rhizomicrobium sp.]